MLWQAYIKLCSALGSNDLETDSVCISLLHICSCHLIPVLSGLNAATDSFTQSACKGPLHASTCFWKCPFAGDEYVEWVGTSIDHFGGVTSPYHKNILPGAREFTNKVGCARSEYSQKLSWCCLFTIGSMSAILVVDRESFKPWNLNPQHWVGEKGLPRGTELPRYKFS